MMPEYHYDDFPTLPVNRIGYTHKALYRERKCDGATTGILPLCRNTVPPLRKSSLSQKRSYRPAIPSIDIGNPGVPPG